MRRDEFPIVKVRKEAYEQGYADAKAKYLDADAYNEGIADVKADLIEKIEKTKEWYTEKYKEISNVQICIVLEDLNYLLEQLKEQKND